MKNLNKEAKASKVKKSTAKKAEVANIEKKAKKKSKVVKEVADQQKASIVEEVVSKRQVKWLYPEDVKDTISRKNWRQEKRNKLHKLELKVARIKDTNSKEYKEALKEFETFRAAVLKPDQIA